MFSKIKKALIGSEEPKVKKDDAVFITEKRENAPEPKAGSPKPRVGYIHLSGCTGEGMSLTENYDILDVVLTDMIDIVYGQTLVDEWNMPEMDICFVEGSVCLQDEHSLKELMEAREKSKILCAFGSCAVNGCFTTFARGGQQAQPKHESFVPVNQLVKVDVAIPGCPVGPEMIRKAIIAVVEGDMDYLKPAMDLASCQTACGCDLLNNVIRNAMCTGCGTCGLACQTRAIRMIEGRPHINNARCIKCGCCYALCPRSWLPEEQIKKDTGL